MSARYLADLYCGGGGTSTGAMQAGRDLGLDIRLTAVNHWFRAIETHESNYPKADHFCAGIQDLDPRKAVPGGHLHILLGSPECTHHSRARSGKPKSDQSRAGAWEIYRWASELSVDAILVENVPEFESWGPLGVDGLPIKELAGQTFKHWVGALRGLGYEVDWRVINAADYGDPTTRKRLFVQARRGQPVTWPRATHAGRWCPARDIIDWSIPGESIFTRRKPLARATLARIAAGLAKFCGADAEPFLIELRNHCSARSLDLPIPTLTTSGAHLGLVQPFLTRYHGSHAGGSDGNGRVHQVTDPLPTLDTSNRYGLVQPFVIGQQSGAVARPVQLPLPTISTSGAISLVQPFLTKFYGTGGACSISVPIDTISTRDRFGLVEPRQNPGVDILFRMLQPHELAAAMSFPADYLFSGTREDKVRQIGNAVAVQTARALIRHILQ